MFEPSVSVIVPVRNGAATIAACVESLLGLDYPKHKSEVIVVDNGSTDRTGALLAGYDGEIRIVSEHRRGAAAARNRGLRAAGGEVIAFTDADCEVDAGWLRNIVAPLCDERVGIAGGKILARRPCNRIEAFGEFIHDHDRAINVYKPPYADTANWSSRVAVLRSVGQFDERFLRGQDSELAYRILQAGYRISYVSEAVVYHRNESTFAGLFLEGYIHGLWSVRLTKKHEAFVNAVGRRGSPVRRFFRLLGHLGQALLGPDRHTSTCHAVFGAGKEVGKLWGSAKWRYPDP